MAILAYLPLRIERVYIVVTTINFHSNQSSPSKLFIFKGLLYQRTGS